VGGVKSYRYEATGLARVANSLADRAVRATRWRATAMFALFIFALFLVIFCRVGALSGSRIAADRFTPAARSSEMIVRSAGVVAAVVLSSSVLSSSAAAQDAVQWRVEDGGNGHWYAAIRSENQIDYPSTLALVTQQGGQLFSGCGEEFDVVITLTNALSTNLWIAEGSSQWLGPWIGLQLESGVWAWTDGTDCVFDRWDISRWQPNAPGSGTESVAFLYTVGTGPAPIVHDVDTSRVTGSYIIEWSADCNNDGVVDYGQIRAGELVDANANNIPDCCETSTSCDPCSADIVEDGVVNAVDLAAVINAWGTAGGKLPRSDVDGSGLVDGADLATVLSSWGACP